MKKKQIEASVAMQSHNMHMERSIQHAFYIYSLHTQSMEGDGYTLKRMVIVQGH